MRKGCGNNNDYYPFGMLMPGRTFALSDYRFGYNTQEKLDDISGMGNHYTALFWEYDPRLGRRWNLDPKPITSISNYAANLLNPIYSDDPYGDDPREAGKFITIDRTDLVVQGKWFVHVNKGNSTLTKNILTPSIRRINDLELYQKAEEVSVVIAIPDFLKNPAAKMPTISKMIKKYQEKISKAYSNSADDFLHASTSDKYELREYDYNNATYTDRYIQNMGVKGFEAEVSYKEFHRLIPFTDASNNTSFVDDLVVWTSISGPKKNNDYQKKDSEFENFQYLQTINEWTKNSAGKWEQKTNTVGVNPRENNTKIE